MGRIHEEGKQLKVRLLGVRGGSNYRSWKMEKVERIKLHI